MQQTLFVLGALSIIMVITVNQQRAIFLNQKNAYKREIETVAADFARSRLEQIVNSVAFDESRVGGTDLDLDTSSLTSKANFGLDTGEQSNNIASYDDLDDYHNYSEILSHPVSEDTFRLSATYQVRYVNPSIPGSESVVATLAKEVIAEIVSVDSIGGATARATVRKTMLATDYIN